jgi:hypothetical protein
VNSVRRPASMASTGGPIGIRASIRDGLRRGVDEIGGGRTEATSVAGPAAYYAPRAQEGPLASDGDRCQDGQRNDDRPTRPTRGTTDRDDRGARG